MGSQNSSNIFPQSSYCYFVESVGSQKIMVEIKTSEIPTTSMQIVMDYITKQIDAIDKARIEMRQENPNFLPRLA